MRKSERLEGLIHVRVTRDEKRRLMEIAGQRGLTLSGLLRGAATEAVRRLPA